MIRDLLLGWDSPCEEITGERYLLPFGDGTGCGGGGEGEFADVGCKRSFALAGGHGCGRHESVSLTHYREIEYPPPSKDPERQLP